MAAGAVLIAAAAVSACGGDPPQIVDYSPQRNTTDVSTAAPIRIAFDHTVDQASVESRLHLNPSTIGSVRWTDGRHLVYEHDTLRPSTNYEVILESGYRDLAGNVYTLRHHWSFFTERPPLLAGSSPSDRDGGVDPSAYLNLEFTRAMDPTRLKDAVGFIPSTPFEIRLDPADNKRAIIAPSEFLAPNTDYELSVGLGATDVDGNQLGSSRTVRFTTGATQPLKHWIAFATNQSDGSPGGLWMVNETGFPRQLFTNTGVQSFNWSPAGDSVLLQGQDGGWRQVTPGGSQTTLSFKAVWAAALASGTGYAYIDEAGVLHRQRSDGTDDVVATDVAEAAVAPNGLRLAFVHRNSTANEIWGYDVGLRSTYQLVTDSAPVSGVAWDPAGRRIAYLRHDLETTVLRVRSLTGTASTTTLISGDMGRPAWLPDSTHLVFAASVVISTGTIQKAFVINVVSPPASLSAAAGLPSDPAIQVTAPASSPDGHQIAFLSKNQVWLMNSDGTRPTALTKEDPELFPYSCRALAWTRT